MVPDVAANADPETGYLVVINGQETPIGGTSAVAPFYSGLFAAFGPKLGFVGQSLWQNQVALTDIISGTNGGFRAGPGPDPCTGLGVPIGTGLATVFSACGSGDIGDALAGTSRPPCGSNSAAEVVVLQAQGRNGDGAPRVSGASFTRFALWHGNGQVKIQINDPNITADSRVFVSISEYATDARVDRFIGDAQLSVSNVAPANGAVVILANVNWSTALNVRFDFLVDPQQI